MEECPDCGKTFGLPRYLHKHIQRGSCKRKHVASIECSICKKKFPRLSHLQRHQLTHWNVRDWPCPHCSSEFAQKAHLVQHIARKHPEESEKVSPEEAGSSHPTCDVCEQTFLTTFEVERHKKNNHSSLACTLCGDRFASRRILAAHRMRHRDGHRCDKCNAAFARRTELVVHVAACNGIRPFLCLHCHSRFTQRVQLIRHFVSTHFSCVPCPDCGCRLSSPWASIRHMKDVHDRIECGFCRKRLDASEQLGAHVESVHWKKDKGVDETRPENTQFPPHTIRICIEGAGGDMAVGRRLPASVLRQHPELSSLRVSCVACPMLVVDVPVGEPPSDAPLSSSTPSLQCISLTSPSSLTSTP